MTKCSNLKLSPLILIRDNQINAVMIVLWNAETILRHGAAGVLPVIGWVLAVLQASLAVQIVIATLRALEVLHWPASQG